MRQHILVTTLFRGDNISAKNYYYFRAANGKTVYCDALMPAEATCKYLLSQERIDDIIILGSDALEETAPATLRDGVSLSTSNLSELTRFDLLRYRLAEFAEELRAEDLDRTALIPDETQDQIIASIRRFFDERFPDQPAIRSNRYFHLLAQDRALANALSDVLQREFPEVDSGLMESWGLSHLYFTLKDTYKMEVLDENLAARIHYVPVLGGDSVPFLKRMAATLGKSGDLQIIEDGADVYIGLQNSEAAVTLDMNTLINLANVLPDNIIRVCRTISTSYRPDDVAEEITDVTESQSILGLLSGVDAFLNNGKAKTIVEYCRQKNLENPLINRTVYAMRNIDYGISLCDINDIERGIRSLRDILSDPISLEREIAAAPMFGFLVECVYRDYGRLLQTEQIEFIDLVKWAYRKEFWQQALTLIESQTPEVMVRNGFYYYCDSEENRDQVLKLFAQIYWDLRPHEKYQMDDVSHYYIKCYSRKKANSTRRGKEYLQSLAHARVEELHTQDPQEIRACTACPDPEALEKLLLAYYNIGDVRNATNHANASFDGFFDIMTDSDCSERMDNIRQAIEYFLYCFEKVAGLTNPEKAHVVKITTEEIIAETNAMREDFKNGRTV